MKPAPPTRVQVEKPVPSRGGRLPLQKQCACQKNSCEKCGRPRLRRSAAGSAPARVPESVRDVLSSPGRPLEPATRAFLEPRFGHDFSAVRIHDDARAADSALAVGAHAYTVGQHIAFAAGRYAPETDAGRRLLAHELTHTLQQRGLQRSAAEAVVPAEGEDRAHEAEAERVAAEIVSGGTPALVVLPALRVERSTIMRAASGQAPWPKSQPIQSQAGAHVVEHEDSLPAGSEQFSVDVLYVPASKGTAGVQRYKNLAPGKGIFPRLELENNRVARAALKQQRDTTSVMANAWLRDRGIARSEADAAWQAAGGGDKFLRLKGESHPCEMDHIVELHLGGDGSPENLQPLSRTNNNASQEVLVDEVWGIANALANQARAAGRDLKEISLYFKTATQTGSAPQDKCLQCADALTLAKGPRPTEITVDRETLVDYRISTPAGNGAFLRVPKTRTAGQRIEIFSPRNQNRAAGLLIPALILEELITGKPDQVKASPDTRPETRRPLDLKNTGRIEFRVEGPQGVLRLLKPDVAISFTYPFLSEGAFTRVLVEPHGGVSIRGFINPTVPFLPRRLDVAWEDEAFRVTSKLDPKTLRSPIPGFRLTKAEANLVLAPQFSLSGELGFAFGQQKSPLVDGSLNLGADASGVTAKGLLAAHIPGVDKAEGSILYANRRLTGQILVEAGQIGLPNVQRGRLVIDFDDKGWHPSGEVELLLPRDLGRATLGFHLERGRLVYTGKGRLRVPGLNEVDIQARYDGEELMASANDVAFSWATLEGKLNVIYIARKGVAGKIRGNGRVQLRRGDFTGFIEVELDDDGQFSGKGEVAYPFSVRGKRVDAKAVITVDKKKNVQVSGAVRVPDPIELFPRFGGARELFHVERKIPIPGASIGPVGLVAVIEGGLSVHYGVGPGELRNVEVTGTFNPLAPDPDPRFTFQSELVLPAQAGIAGKIGGGLGVDAVIASVTGTLTVTAKLDLSATAGGAVKLQYAARRFEVEAKAGIRAELDLGLGLDAHVRARAGVGPFSVAKEKDWKLANRRARLGEFSMAVPIRWASDREFRAPSVDDIQWGPPPKLDLQSVLSQLMQEAPAKEVES